MAKHLNDSKRLLIANLIVFVYCVANAALWTAISAFRRYMQLDDAWACTAVAAYAALFVAAVSWVADVLFDDEPWLCRQLCGPCFCCSYKVSSQLADSTGGYNSVIQ